MKSTWEYKALSEVCTLLTDGNWIESKDQSPEGIRLVQTGNIGIGIYKDKGDKARFISEETFKALNCTEIFEGDVLVSRLPDPIGRSCIIPNLHQRAITAVDCTILRFQPGFLNKFFVYYTLSSAYEHSLMNEITGSSRKRISRSNLSAISVPVPSVNEQIAIISELDSLSDIIDRKNSQLLDFDLLSLSLFHEMFGDPILNEKGWHQRGFESCIQKVKYTTKLQSKDFRSEGKFPIISQEEDFISGYWDNEADVFRVPSPVVIFGDHTRVLKYVDFDFVLGADGVRILLPTKDIEPLFLLYFLKASRIPSLGYSRHFKLLKEMMVSVPPIEEQKRFAQIIMEIDKQKAIVRGSLSQAKLLFDSRIDYWFN